MCALLGENEDNKTNRKSKVAVTSGKRYTMAPRTAEGNKAKDMIK